MTAPPIVTLRRAIAEDRLALWKWRNDPETRRASFNQAEISLEEHSRWLEESLARPDRRIYIVQADGVDAGAMRLDLAAGEAMVNINLAPEWRGRGIGSRALRALCREAFGPLGLGRLTARVKADNAASRAAFEQAGFAVTGHGDPLVLAVAASEARLDLARSTAMLERARQRVPGASQTFSKAPFQFVEGACPVFLERGEGARVWDVDGNQYLDFSMGLASVLLGYADPDVDEAVGRQLRHGVNFSLPHPLEVEVAERLCRLIPCAEMVRFGKNGSDATSGAVRLARAFTGRDVIACCGYHGWQDWFIGTTTRDLGVPKATQELTRVFGYNDLRSLERIFDEHPGRVAAVVMEPVGVEPPAPGFLEAVRDLAQRQGALLVFDEIVTGFRLALGGAQERFGVVPDLACFGKGMSNGFPLAALVGRREIMALLEEVFFSFTAGGEAVALAACLATLEKVERLNVVHHLWRQGAVLRDRFNERAGSAGLGALVRCVGLDPRTVVEFTHPGSGEPWPALKGFFQQECARRGLLFTGAHNLCLAHGEAEIRRALDVYGEVLDLAARAVRDGAVESRLAGPPPQPVFRRP